MATKRVNPYINFDGCAAEAIKLYERALGAKTEAFMRYSDAPQAQCPASDKERVMHACLRIGDARLMISDSTRDMNVARESNVSVMIDEDNVECLALKFEALAADGKVTVPLHDAFWGAKFGMLTDAFGVQWLFNCDRKQA